MKIKTIIVGFLFCIVMDVCAAPRVKTIASFDANGWSRVISTNSCNTVFSPIALSVSAAILGEATTGEHRAKIADALNLMTDFSDAFKPIFDFYRESTESNRVFISLAPSFWFRNTRNIDKNYIRLIQNNFEAEVGKLLTPSTINAWTDVKTDGRIAEILSAIPNNEDAILLTGFAFEGAWELPFNEVNTKNESFECIDKSKINIPMMNAIHNIKLYKKPHFTIARIPFATKGLSMLIMLPKESSSLAELREIVTNEDVVNEAAQHLRSAISTDAIECVTKISLPRIENLCEFDMKDVLVSYGVPMYGYVALGKDEEIDRVTISTYFKISEKSHTLSYSPVSMQQNNQILKPKESFICNRPFLYFVVDERNGNVIIAGHYTGIKGQ